MTIAVVSGVLVAGAVYLFMQREMLRVILGFVLLGHAANLVFMAAGGTDRREEPFGTPADTSAVADPLPQAFVLTAIVIAFSITIFMLVLAVTGTSGDDTNDGATDDDSPDDTSSDSVDSADSPDSANSADSAGSANSADSADEAEEVRA
ncbi:cation:proton antiporter [Saccharomonospora sp. CUA-673]|uniref:sodium:proton antiporter n=1 Tax=Saccharomonospora sp. CUA-673 TaxID=1904969 RepID=UPI000961FA1D|nr:cation:proton antiporter subunit C [Saccharomonospora sp. CUA-673]OLT46219.1 cation:proton antiporter [Saccharomonospora sp. CUA-673]